MTAADESRVVWRHEAMDVVGDKMLAFLESRGYTIVPLAARFEPRAEGLREALNRVAQLEADNDALGVLLDEAHATPSAEGLDVDRLRQALINVNGHVGSGNADSIAAEYDNLTRLGSKP